MNLPGTIIDYNPDTGEITIRAMYSDVWDMATKGYEHVEIILTDGREVSPEQRRKAFALEGDIGRWAGYMSKEDKAELHDILKGMAMEALRLDPFSLSKCSMTTAKDYITFLIDFVLKHDVPCIEKLINRADDIDAYLIACLYNRRCAVCGKPADIHHVDRVGMGRNRATINHVGLKAQALCREHHQKAHQMGQDSFNELNHIYGIRLTPMLVKRLRL